MYLPKIRHIKSFDLQDIEYGNEAAFNIYVLFLSNYTQVVKFAKGTPIVLIQFPKKMDFMELAYVIGKSLSFELAYISWMHSFPRSEEYA